MKLSVARCRPTSSRAVRLPTIVTGRHIRAGGTNVRYPQSVDGAVEESWPPSDPRSAVKTSTKPCPCLVVSQFEIRGGLTPPV